MKTAMITGITGQDGSYLAELLLAQNYKVIGIRRRNSSEACLERIIHLIGNKHLEIVEGEVTDCICVYDLVDMYKPDEIYNLAALSHVSSSFSQPDYAFSVNTKGPLNFLEAIRRFSPATRFYQASTSEMFGKNYTQKGDHKFQDEQTRFLPQSPYAVSKMAAHELVRIYREGYNLFACSGILFNHESERRGENFVTRKITRWLGRFNAWLEQNAQSDISLEKDLIFDEDNIIIPEHFSTKEHSQKFAKLRLGNLNAYRDWGHAINYVHAMYKMLQQTEAKDYVISSGETHSVNEFLQVAFGHIGIDNFSPFIVIDPKFYRPAEVDWLLGDCTKAKQELNWELEITFKQLVDRMVKNDINLARSEIKQSTTTLYKV